MIDSPLERGGAQRRGVWACASALFAFACLSPVCFAESKFQIEEATIAGIQQAILAHELTATELVKIYLTRIKAYNG